MTGIIHNIIPARTSTWWRSRLDYELTNTLYTAYSPAKYGASLFWSNNFLVHRFVWISVLSFLPWSVLVQTEQIEVVSCSFNAITGMFFMPWWRHQLRTFSALLVLGAGNSSVTDEFPSQRPLTRDLDVFFDLRVNKRLSKQSQGWWLETPPGPLWRHCNAFNY